MTSHDSMLKDLNIVVRALQAMVMLADLKELIGTLTEDLVMRVTHAAMAVKHSRICFYSG